MTAFLTGSGWHAVASFLLLSVALAGAGAYATGRALALVWQPFALALLYVVFLTAGERFLHFALFREPLWAPIPCALDYALGLAVAAIAYYLTRARQKARQYGFLAGVPGEAFDRGEN
jgi:hypothetical protein